MSLRCSPRLSVGLKGPMSVAEDVYPSPIFFVPEIGPNDDALLGFPTF